MTKIDFSKIEMLPKDSRDPVFEQRESGVMHTPYKMETMLYGYIEQGDWDQLSNALKGIDLIVVGRLSRNDTRQMQYAAVSCVTLAIRAAIAGGMDDIDAYNLSDRYIQQIDEFDSSEEILEFLTEKIKELTDAVYNVRQRSKYSKHTKQCINYISKHLHDRIYISALADECGLSCDYLSYLFKKETGATFGNYIMEQKLEAARMLIKNKRDHKGVGFYFAFCSESHFISCFKKRFGVTPLQYVNVL